MSLLRLALVFCIVGCSQPSPTPETAMTPPDDTSDTPRGDAVREMIGEVMAVEVDRPRTERAYTDARASVDAVLDALGDPSTWTRGGMPRCRPDLWARLVPPSGEGGATFLFCRPASTGYLHVPGGNGYALPDDVSAALYRATAGLDLPHAGTVAPVAVTENLASVMITVSVNPGPDAAPSLRSVVLHRGARLEPHAQWPDGSPMAREQVLTEAQAQALVARLALGGFFHRASRFHSPALEGATDAPEGSTQGPAPSPLAGTGRVSLTVTAGAWHREWSEAAASAIFSHDLAAMTAADPAFEVLLQPLRAQLD